MTALTNIHRPRKIESQKLKILEPRNISGSTVHKHSDNPNINWKERGNLKWNFSRLLIIKIQVQNSNIFNKKIMKNIVESYIQKIMIQLRKTKNFYCSQFEF